MARDATDVIERWPDVPSEEARRTIREHGDPDEVTDLFLVWNGDDKDAPRIVRAFFLTAFEARQRGSAEIS